jgi:hypothetical protein
MQSIKAITVVWLCWSLAGEASALNEPRKFREYGVSEASCENEMAILDNYALAVQNDPRMRAYVVVYGGRRDTSRREVSVRRARIRRYLVSNRSIESKRVVVADGGFRDALTVELWLAPEGQELPKATATVSPKAVRYQKRRIVDCSTFY